MNELNLPQMERENENITKMSIAEIVCDTKISLPSCSSLRSEIDTIEINSLLLFEMMMLRTSIIN